MKRTILAIAVLALLASAAFAAEDSETITVNVTAINLLEVPASNANLTLTTTTAGAANYDQDTDVDTDGLVFCHNSTTNQKITAVAAKDGDNPTNDITLTVTVEGGAGEQTLVTSGTDEAAGGVVYDAMAAGAYEQDITWEANASLAATKDNSTTDYIWTVTFTSADVEA